MGSGSTLQFTTCPALGSYISFALFQGSKKFGEFKETGETSDAIVARDFSISCQLSPNVLRVQVSDDDVYYMVWFNPLAETVRCVC